MTGISIVVWYLLLAAICIVLGVDHEYSAEKVLSVTSGTYTYDIGHSSFQSKWEASGGIIKRVCYDCDVAFQTIFYKRLGSLNTYSPYNDFRYTWKNSGSNVINVNFELYSSLEDLEAGTNRWSNCNGDDSNIGPFRDCGPSGEVWYQWVSNGRGGRRADFYILTPIDSPTWSAERVSSVTAGTWTYDVGGTAFNEKFRQSSGVIKRVCSSCASSHKTIYYRRLGSLEAYSPYNDFRYTWRNSGDNVFNVNYELYSSISDLEAGTNRWLYCNGDDGNIGPFRDCGPSGEVWDQWVSNGRGGQTADFYIMTGESFINPRGYWQRVGGFGGGGSSFSRSTTVGVTNHEENELTTTFSTSVTSTVSAELTFVSGSVSTELSATISAEIAERSVRSVSTTVEETRTFTCSGDSMAMYQWVTTLTEQDWGSSGFEFSIWSTDIWCVSDDSYVPQCPFGYCQDDDCQQCSTQLSQNGEPLLPQLELYCLAFLVVLLSLNAILCYRNCSDAKKGRARYQKVKIVDSDNDISEAQAINI